MLNLSRTQTPPVGVVVRGGGQLRCHSRHLTMFQNYEVRLQKALWCILNLLSNLLISQHNYLDYRYNQPNTVRRVKTSPKELYSSCSKPHAIRRFFSPKEFNFLHLNNSPVLPKRDFFLP
ncbi:hypothetical protein TNCV_1536681 [Trichonephila clavipes]|nr:hypothetical protein TNCV_1536681 [Trichonephila clavipes]